MLGQAVDVGPIFRAVNLTDRRAQDVLGHPLAVDLVAAPVFQVNVKRHFCRCDFRYEFVVGTGFPCQQ